MPWLHLHVGNEGYVKACCVGNITYGNINQQSLNEIWNDQPIQNLREKFEKGEADPRCQACISIDKAGGKSIRQETFERFPDFDIESSELPKYFDIRFSNVCNFRCRTCWHGASSKWFDEAKQLKRNVSDKAIIQNVKDFDRFIETTKEALLQAEEIYFAGGEPLVTEEHYRLLDFLLENNLHHIRLRYNTNFSKLKFKHWDVVKLWQQFGNVEVLASIEATHELGAYIRKEFSWDDFVANRNFLREECPHVNFKIAPTISVLNIAHLPDLYETSVDLELINSEDLYINLVERPLYYNVKVFPAEEKEKLTEQLSDFTKRPIPSFIKQQFEECISFMNDEDLSKHWSKFLQETQLLDTMRGESWKKFN